MDFLRPAHAAMMGSTRQEKNKLLKNLVQIGVDSYTGFLDYSKNTKGCPHRLFSLLVHKYIYNTFYFNNGLLIRGFNVVFYTILFIVLLFDRNLVSWFCTFLDISIKILEERQTSRNQ